MARIHPPAIDPLRDPEATQAAALLLLLRRTPRPTPPDFLSSVDRHLSSRGIDTPTAQFHTLPPLGEMQGRTARHILRAVHDAWVEANPTEDKCRPRCGCVGLWMEAVERETAVRVLRRAMEDVVGWLCWEE